MTGTLDLNLLPLFVAVGETESMSGAARKLGWPKSSVSRGISALEKALGVQLFHRTTRRVMLTSAGQPLFQKAKILLAAAQDFTGAIPEQDSVPSGKLRVTMPVDFAVTLGAEIASQFAVRFPAISVDVHPSNVAVDLVDEGFDVALRMASKLKPSSLIARKIGQVEMGLYASPSYVLRRGEPRSVNDCASHDWVSVRGGGFPKSLPSLTGARVETDDLLFAKGVIRAGACIGILPSFLAQSDVMASHLVRILPRWSEAFTNLYFVYPQTQHVPKKVAAFRDFVLAFLAARPLSPGSR